MSKPRIARCGTQVAAYGRRRKKQIKASVAERREEGGPISNKWRIEFLKKLAETSNVTEAAAAAGVAQSRVYKVRRGDAEFRAQWRAALLEG